MNGRAVHRKFFPKKFFFFQGPQMSEGPLLFPQNVLLNSCVKTFILINRALESSYYNFVNMRPTDP